jgi:hypothetical protein
VGYGRQQGATAGTPSKFRGCGRNCILTEKSHLLRYSWLNLQTLQALPEGFPGPVNLGVDRPDRTPSGGSTGSVKIG